MGERLTPSEAAELQRCHHEHAAKLYGRACVRTRGDNALAEDIVQETFHAAASQWHWLRELASPDQAAWLHGTMRNISISTFRRNAMMQRNQPAVNERYRLPEPDTCHDAMRAIALQRLWQLVGQLPPQQHLIALMCWGEDMKASEIAEALDVAPGTVWKQLHTVRQKVIKDLRDWVPFGEEAGEGSGCDE